VSEVLQCRGNLLQYTGIDHVVDEESSHEEFHREVVDAAHIAFAVNGQRFHHALDDDFLNRLRGGYPPFATRGRDGVPGEAEFQLVDDFLFKACCGVLFHKFPPRGCIGVD
jgi:hypothetical protein